MSAATDETTSMTEPRSYSLRPESERGADLQRVVRGRISRALEEFTDTAADDLGKGIHEGRKQLKKTRSMLRLLREPLGDDVYKAENDRYRQVGRRLGPARDGEVKLQTLAELHEAGMRLPRGKLLAWRTSLEDEREAALEGARESDLPWAVEQLRKGFSVANQWELPEGGFELVKSGLDRAYRRGRNCFADVRDEPTDERAHELRKRVKDLWYMLDVLSPLWPEVLEPSADEAHDLSSLLGDHHDLTVIVADAQSRDETELTAEAIAVVEEAARERQERLLTESMPIGQRLYAEKRKAFDRRLEGYWNAGTI